MGGGTNSPTSRSGATSGTLSTSERVTIGKSTVNSVLLPQLDLSEIPGLYAFPESPWLRVNMVTSLDGVVAIDDDSKALSCAEDRALYKSLRAMSDAVIVGARTAAHPGYASLTKPLVVISNSGAIEASASTLIAIVPTASAGRVAADHPDALILHAGDTSVDLHQAIDQLHSRGLTKLLCEGGPKLLDSLLHAELVNEMCLTHSPVLIGSGPHLLATNNVASIALSLTHLFEANGFLFTRYTVDSLRRQSVGE
jgi:riboflavin biosynthesis pyrimidine reductase